MFHATKHSAVLVVCLIILTYTATAQNLSINTSGPGATGVNILSSQQLTINLWAISGQQNGPSPLDSPSGSVSALDLKAPGKARHEFAAGYQLLMRNDFNSAVARLATAISLYPDFVAAHNALGTAYLKLAKNDQARDEFARAVSLDDHLPTSYLNLGCAQLALKDYHSAEDSVRKASSLAPVDLQLATALAYTELMNQDYDAVLATAHQVHSRKHPGAAMVHFFAAAAAGNGQNHPEEAETELQTFLHEDPKSPAAEQARNILLQIKVDQVKSEARKKAVAAQALAGPAQPPALVGPTPEQISAQAAVQAQMDAQDSREQKQIAEAEAEPEPVCATCDSTTSPRSAAAAIAPRSPAPGQDPSTPNNGPFTFRSVVDEVAVFFAATDHGKSVTDLTPEDIGIRDDQKSPTVVTGFRNQAQLPLRIGFVIDTSESVTSRFSFEQHAAIDFLQKVLDKNDQAFVVGVANSVLLVQDFTGDQQQISHAINQLAPGGGTALWDAVAFAADKLAARPEDHPVARMLVVISDGKDNSSSTTLREAIASAMRGEVFVYTVSTREATDDNDLTVAADLYPVGDRALKVLADNTGGAAFVPGSIRSLNKGLDDLQEVIRSRYLISYKPALFHRDGHYRAIDISARKSGRKLRVYARKGYYAGGGSAAEATP
jgi:Ca-activated chloride channel family protein